VKISKALSIRLYYDVLSPAENVAKGLLDVREMKKDVVKLLPPPPILLESVIKTRNFMANL
jgi:hypothetical protein